MEIRAAEISAILKKEIANFGNEAEVTEALPRIRRMIEAFCSRLSYYNQ